MLKLVPFKAEHAKELHRTAVDPDACMDGWKEMAEINETCGVGFTGFNDEGKIIFAAGIRLKGKGVGDIWSIFSTDVRSQKKTTFKTLVTILEIVIKEYGFKKIRSESLIGFKESQRLLEHLGFKRQRRNMINGKYHFYLRGA